jgi:hypothetical protein
MDMHIQIPRKRKNGVDMMSLQAMILIKYYFAEDFIRQVFKDVFKVNY